MPKVNFQKIKLVKPNQGWNSLDPRLYRAYSIARNRGYTDLGTYANKAGDHGYWPARAFDLGRKDRFLNLGFGYIKAARLMRFFVKHHKRLNIDYVILGMVIWSRRNGWHRYTRDKSHMYHMHVSMYWPGKWDS